MEKRYRSWSMTIKFWKWIHLKYHLALLLFKNNTAILGVLAPYVVGQEHFGNTDINIEAMSEDFEMVTVSRTDGELHNHLKGFLDVLISLPGAMEARSASNRKVVGSTPTEDCRYWTPYLTTSGLYYCQCITLNGRQSTVTLTTFHAVPETVNYQQTKVLQHNAYPVPTSCLICSCKTRSTHVTYSQEASIIFFYITHQYCA
ncbi:hypothetical protein PROFUN_16721 [Planoprotostelium fungivorum]|uniref:Uncharacterized protein n=1 Tax=Planoprotostelium fungivorum TaxID=1890364 RepID=A0A2P6MPR3_9EUKA|nr:hypothetical protein PROFUN_16721 [Planoprotostelium fungivorum]